MLLCTPRAVVSGGLLLQGDGSPNLEWELVTGTDYYKAHIEGIDEGDSFAFNERV